jgi:hypothetical protein
MRSTGTYATTLTLAVGVALATTIALARVCAAGAAPDLSGTWSLDRAHSDIPAAPPAAGRDAGRRGGGDQDGGDPGGDSGRRRGGWGGGGGGWGGGGFGGGWSDGGRHRRGGEGGDSTASDRGESGPRMRPLRIPDVVHVTETASLVSIEDSTGAVVEEIATVPAAADTLARAPGAYHTLGEWSDGKLVIVRPWFGGANFTDTVSLEDQGRTLVIRTDITRGRDTRTVRRVYRKTAEQG